MKDGAGQEHPIRIGLIGFVPPQIMTWDAKNLEGKANARDIVKAAEAWVPQMREEGADIVIALSHSGMGSRPMPKISKTRPYPWRQSRVSTPSSPATATSTFRDPSSTELRASTMPKG